MSVKMGDGIISCRLVDNSPAKGLERSPQPGFGKRVSVKTGIDSRQLSFSKQTFNSKFTTNSSELSKLSMLYLEKNGDYIFKQSP